MAIQPDIFGEAYFDTSGKRIKEGVPPYALGVPAALRAALGIPAQPRARVRELTAPEMATACLELHAGPGAGVLAGPGELGSPPSVINIQITVDVTSHGARSPYTILGASFSGDICTGPEVTQWQVTEGNIGDPFLFLVAQQVPPTNVPPEASVAVGSCAQSIIILGIYRNPPSYAGIFGFDGHLFSFSHTTLFKGWQACS